MAASTDTYHHDGDRRFYGGYRFDGSTFEFLDYRYDALGRRIYREEPNMLPTSFTYDGEDVLLSNMSGSVTSYQNGPGIDNRLSTKLAGGSGSSSYTHSDHLGTPVAGSTSAGVLTGGTSIPDSFGYGVGGFTGREYDPYLEIQYSRARMYDPKLGRFISEDPIGFAGGDVNLYGYVWNTPTKYLDPMGRDGGVIALGSGTAVASGGGAGIGATVSAVAPPVAVGIAGAAAIYGAWQVGDYIARHPSNPLSKPWVSPDIIAGPKAPPAPYCLPMDRVLPFPKRNFGPLVPPPPSAPGPPDRFSRCESAFTDCKESAGGDPRIEAMCALSYAECVRNPGIPVIFPNGIWVK